MKKQKILFVTLCFFSGLFAVINSFEDSYSITHNINTPFESITMPEIDVEALLLEDEENSGPKAEERRPGKVGDRASWRARPVSLERA